MGHDASSLIWSYRLGRYLNRVERPKRCRTLTGGSLLLPLEQQRVEIRSRGLHQLAEEAALHKGAGTRGIPDVAILADVEERHLVPRYEGTQGIVVVRDHGL